MQLGENYDCFSEVLIFICLWYPNVCVLYTPYDVFKASCSKSEKLLGQAEFLTGETDTECACGLRMKFLGPASSLLALVKTGIPAFFIETYFF